MRAVSPVIGIVLMIALAILIAGFVQVPRWTLASEPLPPCGHNHFDPAQECDPDHEATRDCTDHLHVGRLLDWNWVCVPVVAGGGGVGGMGGPGGPTGPVGPSGPSFGGPVCDPMLGVGDPGHPYEDADNDGAYTLGTDVALLATDVADGVHTVSDPSFGLVIPPSTLAIAATTIDLRAGASGGHLLVGVDLTALAGDLNLTAGGDLEVSSTLLVSDLAGMNLVAGGCVKAPGVTAEAVDPLLATGGTGVSLNGTTLTSLGAAVEVQATGASAGIDIASAFLEAQGRVLVRAGGHLRADGLAATSSLADVDVGTALAGAGNATVRNAVLTAQTDVTVQAGAGMAAFGLAATNASGGVELRAAGGGLNASATLISGQGAISLVAAGDMDVRVARLTSVGSTLTFDLGAETRTLLVEGADLSDDNNVAKAAPSGVAIVGTPASGSVDHTG